MITKNLINTIFIALVYGIFLRGVLVYLSFRWRGIDFVNTVDPGTLDHLNYIVSISILLVVLGVELITIVFKVVEWYYHLPEGN